MPFLIFILFILIFVIAVGFIVIAATGANAVRGQLERVRRSYDGQSFGRKRRATIQFARNGTTFFVNTHVRHGKRYLKIKTRWPMPLFRMKMFPDTVDSKLKTFLGMQDIEVGHAGLDQTYVFQSNDQDELRRIVNGPAAPDGLLRLGRFNLSITTGLCIFEREIGKAQPYNEIVGSFLDVYFLLRDDSLKSTEIKMVVVENENSICMVCGEAIAVNPVHCRSCKTPHHQDCWEYLGMCSTYGCGQKQFRIDSVDQIKIR